MKNALALSQAVGTYSLENAKKLQKEALTQGFTQAEQDGIAKEEIAAHGNWNYLAFKAKVVGTATALVNPFLVLMVFPEAHPNAHVVLVIFALLSIVGGLSFAQWGRREEKRSAVASAVLRARTAGMSRDEISVLKDQPELRKDRDTQRMLTDIQENLGKQAATAI